MSDRAPAQLQELKTQLEQLLETAPTQDWIHTDPVRFPRGVASTADREIVAIFAALIAYGRVTAIGNAITDITTRMGSTPSLTCAADSEADARRRFRGFVYRVTRGEDLARLWLGLGALLRCHGNLLDALKAFDQPDAPDFRPMLGGLREFVMTHTQNFEDRRGFRHFMPDPFGGSAIKRYNMLLRWMVRGPDNIDIGDWAELGTHRLMLPLDTHTHRIGQRLGLTKRTQADWRTAEDITQTLRVLAPDDPTKYDFALAHLGISGAIEEVQWKRFVSAARIVK